MRTRIVLPNLCLLGLTSLMVGCVYVPWFEVPPPGKTDFRGKIGDDRPVRANVSRSQVLAALGEPDFQSVDGHVVAYTFTGEQGYWFYPLCFGGVPADVKAHAVKIVFDPAGRVQRYEMTNANDFRLPLDALLREGSPMYRLVAQLNMGAPEDERVVLSDRLPTTRRSGRGLQ